MRLLLPATLLTLTMFLGGCWHGSVQPPRPPATEQSATPTDTTSTAERLYPPETSIEGKTELRYTADGKKVYNNPELGLYFEYPVEWGNVFVDKRYPIDLPLDSKADQLISIFFIKGEVFASIFSDKIEQADVQEGSVHIFNPLIDFRKSLEDIKQELIKKDQYGGLYIKKIEKSNLNKKAVFLLYEERGYIAVDLYQTIVAPNFFDANDKRNHLMAGLYLAPIIEIGERDKEIHYYVNQPYIDEAVSKAKSGSQLGKFNLFLESIKHY